MPQSVVDELRANRLAAYRVARGDISEHANIEQNELASGYRYRQVLELVQNGADAILEDSECPAGLRQEARIEVLLREQYLYVANTGTSLSKKGIGTLLQSHSSHKRGNQIGRFGLGFKSLLRLGGSIDIFSTTASIRFDPKRCQRTIRDEFNLSPDAPAPGLRLAWNTDRAEAEATDTTLAGLKWATTIVRAEIQDLAILHCLQKEVDQFPTQFLLFLPVAVTLDLDAGVGLTRRLRREPDGPDFVLHDGDKFSRWRVETREVHITKKEALDDASKLHVRDRVPLVWAVPLDNRREEAGRFWAFFPTDTLTRLPGILNAPWKIDAARNAIEKGEWNTALMQEAAKLITHMLPSLATADDPGRPLDSFPRQLDRPDEPAAPLVETLWAAIENASIVADARGRMRNGKELRRPPHDDHSLHEQWLGLTASSVQAQWVHPSCLVGNRAARLKELADRIRRTIGRDITGSNGLTQAKAADWFGEVATVDSGAAKAVLKLAESYAKIRPSGQWNQERQSLAIIPSESGQLCTPGQLVIADGVSIPNRETVAHQLVADPEILRILTAVLDVKRLDNEGWRALLDDALVQAKRNSPSINSRTSDKVWCHLWDVVRLAPNNIQTRFLADKREEFRIRRRDGAWVLNDEVLLPGSIVSIGDTDESNRSVLVDETVHGTDQELLNEVGVFDHPTGLRGPGDWISTVGEHEKLLRGWLSGVETDYRNKLDSSSSPQSGYLRPIGLSLPKGWMLLAQIRGPANAKLTQQFLSNFTQIDGTVAFGHTSRPKAYPQTQVSHPMHWFIRRHGTIAIGAHAVPLEVALARRGRQVFKRLEAWQTLAPLLDGLDRLVGGTPIPVPTTDQIAGLWQALFSHLATSEALASDNLQDLWSDAARDGCVPESLPTANNALILADLCVTGSANLARIAREKGRFAITLDADTLRIWISKGARNLDEMFRVEWSEVHAPVTALTSAMPEIAEVLRDELQSQALCQSVADLRLVIDDHNDSCPCVQWQGVLHLDPAQLDRYPRSDRLFKVLQEAASAGWLKMSVQEALRCIGDAQVDSQRNYVAAGSTLAERLLRAVGYRQECLRQVLGETVQKVIPPDVQPERVAALALALLGPTTLSKLADTLKAEGLKPPTRWGTAEARAFVSSIGFPDEFAASAESKRDPELTISGPIHLKCLHDYQKEVVEGLRTLIASGTGRRRAVVSLPTGGGKTRVTVQAAVDLILKVEGPRRLVLWVAQTDELCEQAVQSFRQVWLNRGTLDTDLRIVRLWGGHANPSPSANGQPTVVIASIQTLNSRLGADNLGWLSIPGLVVVDECHHAITKSYTRLLRELDAEAPRPGAVQKDEPPIIGLSATPFRGTADDDDEESIRLAKRFDKRLLPADQSNLHERLIERGFLSKVDLEPLKLDIPPTEKMRDLLKAWSESEVDKDSTKFENLLDEINRHLASDETRNQKLVEIIDRSDERSILFFTNSVDHAIEMATRLLIQGITAAAVSGDTPASARRYFLDQFQHGDIRVLCNHSVLTTGFDAPKTDMVLIARQVFSPVRYMQMVGRGLRGEANGGTQRCRIVTVLDNLGRFSEQHPYNYCAKFFAR